eukprot:m.185746 g.185746  ORF g.185746 m.185746 type:complete len:182 (+) comp24745_c0_seq1:28-573(+)
MYHTNMTMYMGLNSKQTESNVPFQSPTCHDAPLRTGATQCWQGCSADGKDLKGMLMGCAWTEWRWRHCMEGGEAWRMLTEKPVVHGIHGDCAKIISCRQSCTTLHPPYAAKLAWITMIVLAVCTRTSGQSTVNRRPLCAPLAAMARVVEGDRAQAHAFRMTRSATSWATIVHTTTFNASTP